LWKNVNARHSTTARDGVRASVGVCARGTTDDVEDDVIDDVEDDEGRRWRRATRARDRDA